MSDKTLFKGGCVLTLDPRVGNLATGDVLVVDGRISEIGAHLRARDADTVDCTDAIIMPGFVDAHRHLWRTLFRNAGTDGTGRTILAEDHRGHHQPDDVYAATLAGLLGAAASGTTAVVDWADIPRSPDHLDAALQAHADAGIRSVFVHPADQAIPAKQLLERFPSAGLSQLAIGGADPASPTIDQIQAEWTSARDLGLRVHAHAGTTDATGAIAQLGARGALGDDITLVHGTNLSDADLDAVADSGASIVVAPSTEMASGLGTPPIQQLIDRDIDPGLGVDDESLAPGDLFAQMRATISIQHATLFEAKLAGKAGLPKLMTTREIIRHGTIDGAKAAGLPQVGTLTPGNEADVIVLRTDRPNIYPVNDPIGAVVWGMDTSNLDSVFVRGRAIVRDGELLTDLGRVRTLAAEAQRRIAEAVGEPFSSPTGAAR